MANKKRRFTPLRIFIGFLIFIFVCYIGFVLYVNLATYPADDRAYNELVALKDGNVNVNVNALNDKSTTTNYVDCQTLEAEETELSIAVGSPQSQKGLVLYPGALVDPVAYVPLAHKIAEQGFYCVIVKMPFNFAFFNSNAANNIIASAPQVQCWWIAGHSLGGVMAASFASENTDKLKGVVLLAAYSTKDLSNSGLKVLNIYGSEDGVLNFSNMEKYAENLPSDTKTLVIEGGNHSGVGYYGAQANDGEARISKEEQQAQTVSAIVSAMKLG